MVPDQAPTIQAALDANADTIGVRDGLVPERLIVTRFVRIEAASLGQGNYQVPEWKATPSIQSLKFVWESSYPPKGIEVVGFRFLGPVEVRLFGSLEPVSFESCRFDSTLDGYGNWFTIFLIRGCMFLGSVKLNGYVQFVGNTLIGSTLTVRADGLSRIQNNYFQGPADAAMELDLSESISRVAGNTIRGVGDGIRLTRDTFGTRVVGNDIADCSGDGIVYRCSEHWGAGAYCDSNRVERCGGAGIVVRGTCVPPSRVNVRMTGNFIRGTGSGGIAVASNDPFGWVRENVVLDAGEDGISVGSADSVSNNVVGRSAGAGIRVGAVHLLTRNTVFANGGGGFHVTANEPARISHNISAFNRGPGLEFHGSVQPQLSCNDWYLNRPAGPVGMAAGSSDLSLDPRFCDFGAADVHLAAGSPLLAAGSCGRIGALGQGCGGASPNRATGSAESPLRVWPIPAAGHVAFEIPASTETTTLEIFDISGARRRQFRIPPGTTVLEWDRRETGGHPAPPGIYFARLSRASGGEVASVRVVLAD